MALFGTVDLGGIDVGNVDSFGQITALARVLKGRACTNKWGRWVIEGGVQEHVQLDHPTVLRVLGEPLEGQPGTVYGMDDAKTPDWSRQFQAWADAQEDEAV